MKDRLSKTPDRRSFLKFTGSSLVFASASGAPKLVKAATREADVIVIGSGMAGLSAARKLVDLDYSVIILEAADYIGGRLKTDWSLGAPFEVGAGWIHSPDGNPLSDLVKAVDGKTYITDDEDFEVYTADGADVPYDDIYDRWSTLEKLYRKIDASFDGDQPLSKAIELVSPKAAKDPILQWMFSAYTEFDAGGPIEDLSAYYFDEDETFDGEDVVVLSGYDQLLKPLLPGLDIRLNQKVTLVEYEAGDGATVYVGDTEYESDFVICTVSLGVLQAGDIKFDPPLPKAHRRRIKKLGMGSVTKLALQFDDAFWPTDVQYFGLMTEEKGRWNYWVNYRKFSGANIILGLSVGAYAFKADAMSDRDMIADAMKAVRTMFGDDAPEPIAHLATRWSKNPLTKGPIPIPNLARHPRIMTA